MEKKNKNQMPKNYYLGLDIGTNSVGWAVTDENYNLCKFKKKTMWGIRLFEKADTAEERRIKRTSRRRLQRRKQRIDLLQELFETEINKIDPTFFIRLNESRLHLEDKKIKEKYPLFISEEYSDKEYHKQYPTIFHLRKELIESGEPHDVRLVYLALHHIIKYRGHFLIDGELAAATSFKTVFSNIQDALRQELGLEFEEDKANDIEDILRDKHMPKSEKTKHFAEFIVSSEKDDSYDPKQRKSVINNICKLLAGNKGDIAKIFSCEMDGVEKTSFSFSEAGYNEIIRPNLAEIIPDQCSVIDMLKAVYDWNILVDILGDEDYLSAAKVKKYEIHRHNLSVLKRIINKYCARDEYKKFFKSAKEENNYVSYIGSTKSGDEKIDVKKCNEEDFYKGLKKLLEKINPDASDAEVYKRILKDVDSGTLLPLQRSKENSVIPYQVHKQELDKILENAGKYLDFLNERDDDGLNISDKIKSLFSFRIPYYVGPLSDRHKKEGANVWIARKAEGRILPWNFDKMVDKAKSNESFIERMTSKCTYVLGEDVIPKNSLLYSRFMVLNELNNLKILGKQITVKQKQDIYNKLFKNHARVTGKMLLKYCRDEMMSNDLKQEDLSGFDGDFKSSLTSYMDFYKKVFGKRIEEDGIKRITEDVIKWKTIYGDDNKMLMLVLENVYSGKLSDDQKNAIKKFRYSGWGNFSEKFLNGIEGQDKETGEVFTIIEALWNTNCNLMQLLSGRFTFANEIEKYNKSIAEIVTEVSYDSLIKDLYVSPSNKRAIWQTVQIAEEIRHIMGGTPEKIFIEMARGGDKSKNRTKSRKTHLIELYAACRQDTRDWNKELEDRNEREFNSDKLYLYYTQMGKCMYSGETIDLNELMSANSKWDIDHIYPQSKVKDDSLDNRVLALRRLNNEKGNRPLDSAIQDRQREWWRSLLDRGFISKKKYDRLTHRGELSTEELSGFISRQLVETRQSTKAVAGLFRRIYEDSEIVYVKAQWVSQFRKEDLNVLKSRLANDYHHAKDAYLNIVVGNVYNTKFTDNPINWLKKHAGENYSINQIFNFDAGKDAAVWKAPMRDDNKRLKINGDGEKYGGTIDLVRKMVKKNDVLYTEYTYCDKGALFNETIAGKGGSAKIPLKKNLDINKYGGYTSANTSYFSVIEFDGKKGERVKNVMEVPIYIADILGQNPNAYIEYCENIKGLKNVRILHGCIKKNALISFNGYPVRIRGANENQLMLKNNLQPLFGKNEETVRRIEKYLDKNADFEVDEKNDGLTEENMTALYDDITEKLLSVYKKRPANKGADLAEKRGVFLELTLKEKAKLLNQAIKMVKCDIETKADLSTIGKSKLAGNMAVSKNSFGSSRLVMINQSVTGLFENRIEL